MKKPIGIKINERLEDKGIHLSGDGDGKRLYRDLFRPVTDKTCNIKKGVEDVLKKM